MARVAEMSQKNAHGWDVVLDAFPYLKTSSFAPADDFPPSTLSTRAKKGEKGYNI
jgi:hypothetical protein